MEYAGTQVGKSVQEKPVISRLIEQIERATANIDAAADRLYQAGTRLLNQEPTGIEKDGPTTPIPSTVEAQLQDRVRHLETLGSRLHGIAERFERAV